MTRTTLSSQSRQSNHGHKRKGKPVEAWMLELEKAQDEENGSQSLDLSAIEQIADGVEQMVFSWGLDRQERGQEYAKLSKSLANKNSNVLLPWSLQKREEGLDYSFRGHLAARKDILIIPCNSAPAGIKSRLAQSRSAGLGHLSCETSPELAQTHMNETRCHDPFGNARERSLSPAPVLADPHPLPAAGYVHQSNFDDLTCSNQSLGVIASNDRAKNCAIQNEGKTEYYLGDRLREDSICHAPQPEEYGFGASSDFEVRKDKSASGLCTSKIKSTDGIKKGREYVLVAKDTNLPSCLEECVHQWTSETAPSTPQRKRQPSLMNHTRIQSPSPILAQGRDGNESPLIQPPLYEQPSSERPVTTQGSEVSQDEDGLLRTTELCDHSPLYNKQEEDLSSLLPFVDTSGRDVESVEVGGHTIKVVTLRSGDDVLEDKFQALVNINAGAPGVQEASQLNPSPTTTDVEELQIALLECAMEYEIKTIETKMKMQELKLKGKQNVAIAKSEHICPQKAFKSTSERPMEYKKLLQLKKKMLTLQHEKGTLNNELHALKKKERQFERQRRSLEDALLRVNRLQREVVKKDQEVVEWQLKEKETQAQLQDVGEKLRRARHAHISQPIEPKKLLTLLPALREWLRSLKKVGLAKAAERLQIQEKEEVEASLSHPMDSYYAQPPFVRSREKGNVPSVPAHLVLLGQLSEDLANQSSSTPSVKQVDVIICCLTKEIQALQKELTKLARN